MRVGGPRISAIDPIQQALTRRTGGGPETECAIDVYPGVHAVCDLADFADRITSAGIHVSDLRTDDHRPLRPRNLRRLHTSLRICWNGVYMASSKTEQRQSLQHRRVNLLADYDGYWWRRKQSLTLHIPAGLAQYGLASGSQGRDICHLCASYKGPARGRREAKQVQ